MYTEKDARKTWLSMVERCSSGYADLHKEWLNYDNFKQWYFKNIYGTKQFKLQLDKDLFSKGERIYSSKTCCFLPQSLNTLLASCISRNELLPGVILTSQGTFKTVVKRNTTVIKRVFKTEKEAFDFYRIEKEKNIKIATMAYEFLLPERIYHALMKYEVKELRGIKHNSLSKKELYMYPVPSVPT